MPVEIINEEVLNDIKKLSREELNRKGLLDVKTGYYLGVNEKKRDIKKQYLKMRLKIKCYLEDEKKLSPEIVNEIRHLMNEFYKKID